MSKFTKEEISLCKQVAEKHRKEIEYGDWFLNEGGFVKVWPYRHNCKRIDVIPLWTISDCLEFLIKKGYYRIDIVALEGRFVLWLVHKNTDKRYEPDGDTILEACLKAVLAILEESK